MGDDPQPPPGADNGWGAPPPDGGGWGSPPADGGFGAGGGGAAGFGAGGSGAQHPGGGHQGPQPAGFGGPPPGMPPGFVPGAGQQVDTAVPWEIPGGGLFARWFDTLSAANFKGAAFYRAAGQSDDAMSAVMFNTFTWAVLGALAGAVYVGMFAVMGALWVWFLTAIDAGLAARVGTMTVSFGLLLWLACTLLGAAWGFVGPWIIGGLHHLVLSLFGGIHRDKGFAHTVRAHAYANGAASIWIVVPPVLGLLIAVIFHAKNHMQAYGGVHDCGDGKASVAWFMTPVCGVCSCCMMITACAALAG